MKNKKSGLSLIEIVVVVAIVGILGSYSYVKFDRMRENNVIDADKTKLISTISNANIDARVIGNTRYFKILPQGIIVVKKREDVPVEQDEYALELDPGTNEEVMKAAGYTAMFNCTKNNSGVITKCPVAIFDKGFGNSTPIDNKTWIKSTIPTGLSDINDRNANKYVMLRNGTIENGFTTYLFDKHDNAKYKVQFLVGVILQVCVYNYVGPEGGINYTNILSKHQLLSLGDTADWKVINQKMCNIQ